MAANSVAGRRDSMGFRVARHRVNVGNADRFLAALGGGALLLSSLGKKGIVGRALTALGWALTVRGAIGACRAYRTSGLADAGDGANFASGEPRSRTSEGPSWARTAIVVRQSVTVQRPREQVYRYLRGSADLLRFMAE